MITPAASRGGRALAALAAVLSATACGTGSGVSGRGEAAATVARNLMTAAQAGNSRQACLLLAPETRHEVEQESGGPCAQALLDMEFPPADVPASAEVYGRQAMVQMGQQTVFLVRVGSVWRVNAAGCTPRPSDLPYDCTIKGG